MPITTGHNGERVHYNVRVRPFGALSARESPADTARDFATKNGTMPKGTYLLMRMEVRGNDIYTDMDMDLRGALNPLTGLMNPGEPSWFQDGEFLPAPPAPPTNPRSPTNSFARFAYMVAHWASTCCNNFMRWLSLR